MAGELAAPDRGRWEIEGVFDKFKIPLCADSTVLRRMMTPDLVQQDRWELLLARFAVRPLMARAA